MRSRTSGGAVVGRTDLDAAVEGVERTLEAGRVVGVQLKQRLTRLHLRRRAWRA